MNYKKINTEPLDSFFSFGSKLIIFIPVLILIVAIIGRLNQTANTITSINNTITPTVKPVEKINFDTKGPYKCAYKNDKVSLTAYVKNNNALVNITQKGLTKKYLLMGDCIFVDNQKTCGVSMYIPIAQGLLNSNISMVNTVVSQKIGADINVKSVLDSCKKEDFDSNIIK